MSDTTTNAILTEDEIQSLYPNINKDIVLKGLAQAEDRLKDCLTTKKELEKRTFVILSLYVIVQLVTFSVSEFSHINPSVFMLTFGSILLLLSLKSSNYGALGRLPIVWLRKDVLDGSDEVYVLTLAHILHRCTKQIKVSLKSNKYKSRLLDASILFGASSPIIFMLSK